MVQNQEMTREQKRLALQECFSEEQQSMLQQNKEVREQNREMVKGNLSEAKKEQIRNNGRGITSLQDSTPGLWVSTLK